MWTALAQVSFATELMVSILDLGIISFSARGNLIIRPITRVEVYQTLCSIYKFIYFKRRPIVCLCFICIAFFLPCLFFWLLKHPPLHPFIISQCLHTRHAVLNLFQSRCLPRVSLTACWISSFALHLLLFYFYFISVIIIVVILFYVISFFYIWLFCWCTWMVFFFNLAHLPLSICCCFCWYNFLLPCFFWNIVSYFILPAANN